jgi:hypothetical protein
MRVEFPKKWAALTFLGFYLIIGFRYVLRYSDWPVFWPPMGVVTKLIDLPVTSVGGAMLLIFLFGALAIFFGFFIFIFGSIRLLRWMKQESNGQYKFIGGFSILYSVLGVLWVLWFTLRFFSILSFISIPISSLVISTAGVVAGIGWLRNIRWCSYLLLLFYAVQIVHFSTKDFGLSLATIPEFDLKVYFDWLKPHVQLALNLFALGMFVWSALQLIRRTSEAICE